MAIILKYMIILRNTFYAIYASSGQGQQERVYTTNQFSKYH